MPKTNLHSPFPFTYLGMGVIEKKAGRPLGELGSDLLIEANDEVVKGATEWYKSYPQKS